MRKFSDSIIKSAVWLLKKSELLSALSIRLVYITGKSEVPLHPKHLIRKDLRLYKELIGKEKVVLDIGCGPGQHTAMIAGKVKKVIGIDKDEKSLEIAVKDAGLKKIKNTIFLIADVEKKLNFKSETFDSIIMIDVLEHINRRQSFLTEVKRVLNKKGKILVVIPNKDTTWKKLQRKYGFESFSDPDHKIEYTEKLIKKELERAGLKVTDVSPIGYDTPLVGIIDLIGGISLPAYKRLSKWKARQVTRHQKECSGFKILASK